MSLPPDLDAPARRAGRRARARRADRRLRRDLPRLGAARAGSRRRPGASSSAGAGGSPTARGGRASPRSRGGAGRRAGLLHAGGARARRTGRARSSRSRGRAHVSAVFTHPDRWRQGIAAALLAVAEDAMRAAGYARGRSSGRPEHAPARRFYEADGLAPRRPPPVARRDGHADRGVRQGARVRIYLGAFGDPGHAFPMLALGEALVARGHAVALQTWRRWEQHATAAGMTFAAAPEYQVFPTRERPLKPYEAAVARRAGDRPVGRGVRARPRGLRRPHARARARRRAVRRARGDPRPARASRGRRPASRPTRSARGCRGRALGRAGPGGRFDPLVAKGLAQGRRRVQRLPRAARAPAAARAHTGLSRLLTLVATLPQLEYPRRVGAWLRVDRAAAVGAARGRARRAAAGRRARSCSSRPRRRRTRSTRCCARRWPGCGRARARDRHLQRARPGRRSTCRPTPCSCPGSPTRGRCRAATSWSRTAATGRSCARSPAAARWSSAPRAATWARTPRAPTGRASASGSRGGCSARARCGWRSSGRCATRAMRDRARAVAAWVAAHDGADAAARELEALAPRPRWPRRARPARPPRRAPARSRRSACPACGPRPGGPRRARGARRRGG